MHAYGNGDVDGCADAIADALAAPGVTLAEEAWSWRARAEELLAGVGVER